MLTVIYNRIINFLSFTPNLRALRNRINSSIDQPDMITEFPDSHPRGFVKQFRKRRATIAETYLRITKSLDSANYNQRIRALKLLAEHITYSRSLQMPLNAARVQLAIMKEVVKNRYNERTQLELMRDFTVSSFGHPRAIRRYLKKFDMIEVPERGEELGDLKMGWDYHVHDNTSYGLKSPIQLLIDAFIKGMSELTVVYNNLEQHDAVKEVLEAGKILGIKVNIAIEFSAITHDLRFHYLYIFPEFSSKKGKFKRFLKEEGEDFRAFLNEIEEIQHHRKKDIRQLIKNFNEVYLPAINEGYDSSSIYYLKPLSADDEIETFGNRIYSRRQLGEFLFPRLKEVYEYRALQITALKKQSDEFPDLFSHKEIEAIHQKYLAIRHQYRLLDPETIRNKYFADSDHITSEKQVSNLHEIFKLAKKASGTIKLISPLEHGLHAAIELVLQNVEVLSSVEIFNTYDSIRAREEDIVAFARFLHLLNEGHEGGLVKFLQDNQLSYRKVTLSEASKYIRERKIIPSIGSDATGRSTLVPGMGFIFRNRIVKNQRRYFDRNHQKLPAEVSSMIFHQAHIPRFVPKEGEKPDIVCLGRVSDNKGNLLGDEKLVKPTTLKEGWEYLNPTVKNFLFMLIGFIPAYLTLGVQYAMLWFAITGTRNIFVDGISGKGFNPFVWNYSDINWTNFAQSLLFTGFSVPILGFVKTRFDVVWTGTHEGAWFEIFRFFFINISNGIYIATHNYIRGFDKTTIRANFFRSIIAWPFSVVFSPIGNLLMIPSIVQAKFWSDFVAAIIEGSNKYRNTLKVQNMMMKRLMPDLLSDDKENQMLAILDMIYFLKESKRARTALFNQMIPQDSLKKKIKKFIWNRKKKFKLNDSFYEIKNALERKSTFNDLVNFIIAHYNREQSLFLLNMLAENYPKIRRLFSEFGINE